MVEGDDEVILRSAPADVDVPLVDGGRRGGEAVVLVLAAALAGELARPAFAAVLRSQAHDGAPSRLFVSAGDEETLAPHDGTGVSSARQAHLPGVVLLGPF